ncbi:MULTISPECIES: AraC family transcriptional regulator [unclassified Breznakia]|uniref:AraC family transcriptional regulator n=1 Tax=unclassified Breznakia TaxID=2623764 RepID=UPI002473EBDB|nr:MULTISPECIES: AraC family transcriptional regulator [unclassified Breznakia]MDH6366047.1 AraC family transcriptional regulator [Breznakia sp. PH1-1]MDH6403021.1 AraC family transcriptional regulator [Breznakia sp. PF1-11]MDH6410730.1 AraC family transcriptional regulator [Breznakia sp. PFB1-11]MDH6413213.1 AraC family transcriptional regulator [Breznakia sp. PFB1-14]MDH6415581.1 AraC family transcriptional regulator [Breznakia sp. PFB1-4]
MITVLNQVVDYIEEHLYETVDFDKLAKKFGMSAYHLKRTFSFISGVSITQYIRLRRLSQAIEALHEGYRISDVAYDYGYDSLDGFTRAIKQWTNYTPSDIVVNHVHKEFPRLSFQIQVTGGQEMEYRIEEKPAFTIVGVSRTVSLQFSGVNDEIVKLAQSIKEKQREEIHKYMDMYPNQVVNASFNFTGDRTKEEGTLTHMIGALTTSLHQPISLQAKSVAAHTWAIFPSRGAFPKALQDTWANIASIWLPASSYELVEAPEISFTKFLDANQQEAYSEIWIAVRKKM